MQAATDAEVREWITKNSRSSGIKVAAEGRDLYYDDPEANCIDVAFPETPMSVPYFARAASILGIAREESFYGALLWFTLWTIGSPGLVRTGWKIIEKMRLGFGETRPLDAASGHFFRSDEFVELNAFLVPCFTFGWDAYLVPCSSNDYFAHISHDEFWCIITRTREAHERLMEELQEMKPESGHTLQLQRFCPGRRAAV